MSILDELKGMFEGSDITDAMVKRQFKRKLHQALEQVPPAKIRQVIQERLRVTELLDLLPQDKQGAVVGQAQKYGYLVEKVTNEEFFEMLPHWVKDILDEEDGYSWLNRELNQVRDMVKEVSDAGSKSNGGRNNQSGPGGNKAEGTRVVYTYRPVAKPAEQPGGGDKGTSENSGHSGVAGTPDHVGGTRGTKETAA